MLPYLTARVGAPLSITTALVISFIPGLLTSRRIKTAAIARIGTMNSETLAPSEYRCLRYRSGSPLSRRCGMIERTARSEDAHDIEFAKVTINENRVVIAIMLRIIGSVTYQMRCHQLAPSRPAS